MNNYRLRKHIFLVLTILAVAFIFGQSLLGRASSDTQSGRVLAAVMWLLERVGFTPDAQITHHFVRKCAHFAEFAALGICVGGYTYNLGKLRQRQYVAFPAWLTLLVAVSDELLQSFTGRSAQITDVVLDYAGALCGLLAVAGFLWIKNKRARNKNHEN